MVFSINRIVTHLAAGKTKHHPADVEFDAVLYEEQPTLRPHRGVFIYQLSCGRC